MLFHQESPPRRAWLAALAVLVAGSGLVRANSIDRELIDCAPKVLQYLKDKKCTNFGVLKFRVGIGNAPATDNAGVFNLDVADRLTVALILADDAANPLGIIRNASAVVKDKLPEGIPWTETGRQKLFEPTYPLAWGDAKVRPEGFLTGEVRVNKDLHDMTVQLQFIDREGRLENAFNKDDLIRADMSGGTLVGLGQSFLLRGAFEGGHLAIVTDDGGKTPDVPVKTPDVPMKTPDVPVKTPDPVAPVDVAAVKAAVEVKEGASFPLEDKDCPIALEIFYGGEKITPVVADGKASIPEPREGQEVVLKIKRTEGARGRGSFGVVLKVNGVNTLFSEEIADDFSCRKWVLEPGDDPTTIRGYQTDAGTAGKFKVLSPAASKLEDVNYGKDVGTITMVVFREARADEKVKIAEASNGTRGAVRRGQLPAQPPKSLSALRYQLKIRDSELKGFIPREPGDKVDSPTKAVPFEAAPDPIGAVVITYYHRQ